MPATPRVSVRRDELGESSAPRGDHSHICGPQRALGDPERTPTSSGRLAPSCCDSRALIPGAEIRELCEALVKTPEAEAPTERVPAAPAGASPEQRCQCAPSGAQSAQSLQPRAAEPRDQACSRGAGSRKTRRFSS